MVIKTVFYLFVFLGLVCSLSYAQGPIGQPTGRPSEEQLPIPEGQPAPAPRIQLPMPPPPAETPGIRPSVTAFITQVKIAGSTVFTAEELGRVTAPYTNRSLTSEDLEALRVAVTVFYVNHGYVNSGAVIPDQAITDGVLTLQIIEGRLTRIDVEGNRLFRSGYLRDRIELPAGTPLNIKKLQGKLQILQQDERIEVVNANVRPGSKPGEAVIDVKVKEADAFRAYFEYNNYQTPTVGAELGMLTLQHLSLTGNGDILSFGYGGSEGIDPRIETYYSFPFNRYDGTFTVYYQKNDFKVIEQPFKDLDIESRSDIVGVTVRQPVYRTVQNEVALGVTGERIYNRTYLLDEPFSFYPGVEDGRSVVTAIRFFQEWFHREASQFIALRSRFSFGISALESTINSNNLPDSRFFEWLVQGRWAFRHWPFNMETFVRVDAQLTPDSLLPVEQMAIGGRYTVRGYRESQLVRDNGVSASIETRFPLARNKPWASILDICAFYDFGHAWNTDLPSPEPRTLDSVGLGIRWALDRPWQTHFTPQFELYWGIPLRNVETAGGDLQDSGIHFRFLLMYW